MEDEELNLAEMKARIVVAYERELCVDDAIVIHTAGKASGDNTFIVNNEKAHAQCKAVHELRETRRFVVIDHAMKTVFDDEATVPRIKVEGSHGQLFIVTLAKKRPVLDMRDQSQFHLLEISRHGYNFGQSSVDVIVEFDLHACKKTTEDILAAYEGRTNIDALVREGDRTFKLSDAMITEYTLERDEGFRGDVFTITMNAASVVESPS